MLKKIVKNTTCILLGNVVNKISSIILLFFFSRYLGATGFGLYSFIFFYVGLFGSLTDLGVKTTLVRELARPRQRKELYLGNSIILAITGTVAALCLSIAISFVAGYTSNVKALIALASLSLVFSFRDLTFRQIYESVFQVNLKMEYPTIINALNEILVVFSCLAVIMLKGSLGTLICVYVLGYVPGFICIIVYANKCMRPVFSLNKTVMKEIIKLCFPLGMAVALTSVYDKIGGVLLQVFKGSEAVGYYSVAYRVSVSLKIIPFALMISLFPLLSEYYAHDRGKFLKYFNAAVKYILLIALPMGVIVTLFSEQIVVLVSGKSFIESATSLVYMIWAVVFLFITIVFFYTLISMNKQVLALFISGVMLTMNVILNIILIQKWSYVGASITLLLTEIIGFILALICVKRYVKEFSLAVFFKAGCAFLGMLAVIFVPCNILVKCSLSVLVFFVIAFFMKLLTHEEFALIKGFMRSKNK
ncbi:MAG: flippase [Candidatus Ancaeobacter aquaticus]|nr:flippase [Candidatus Ancaeobacter aquaticus]